MILEIFSFLAMAVVIFFYLLSLTFILWMVIDAGRQDKFWWMVLILGLPIVGALAYYFTEKRHDYLKIKKSKGAFMNDTVGQE